MNLRVELDDNGSVTVEASEVHPIEHDTAARLIIDITTGLHRALHPTDAE